MPQFETDVWMSLFTPTKKVIQSSSVGLYINQHLLHPCPFQTSSHDADYGHKVLPLFFNVLQGFVSCLVMMFPCWCTRNDAFLHKQVMFGLPELNGAFRACQIPSQLTFKMLLD